jgi:hypothetical protein
MDFASYTLKLATIYRQAIDKSQLDQILTKLSDLPYFKDRIDLAEKEFEHLSSGSSRIIYRLPDDTVLKLAKNKKGLAQNKIESDPGMSSPFVNPTLRSDPSGIWKVSPFRTKITEKEFQALTDIDFKDFGNALKYALRSFSGDKDQDKPAHYDQIARTPIFQDITKIAKHFKVLPGDLARISSWSEHDDHPIATDMGLTREIYDTYYDDES